ncbi:hypothetical protein IJ541_08390 [bacterium]|nr:hypothetical protein [bacterium]
MKQYFIIILMIVLCLPAFGQNNNIDNLTDSNQDNKMFVICSPNKKMCTVGQHSMTSTNKPLYTSDGIVCSFNRKTCTNGFTYMRSTTPIEIVANSVLCTKNKKICAIGKHKITSNSAESLYIENGIVCTSNKKLCTNGFRYIRSNVPLK